MLSVRKADLRGKRVFLRVDFNVPMEDRKILDNFRIKQTLPTINYLIEKKAKIIIGTHLGQPGGEIIPNLSTISVAGELAKLLNRNINATDHVIHPLVVRKINRLKHGEILILGNLRWHREEEQNNEQFAKDLASYTDLYVNDAFGVSHRAHASVEGITRYLPSYAGFLLESEIETLKLLLNYPEPPFVLVLGGAKVKDKSPLIFNLAPRVDKILIGGAMANTFLKAIGKDVSESLYEPKMVEKCQDIMERFGDKIYLPIDNVKEKDFGGGFKILDIGQITGEEFSVEIKRAKTVFWNGNMGYSEDRRYSVGTRVIAKAISDCEGTSVVAGGDTVGFLDEHQLTERVNFISTGGGATLSFLAGEELPAISALNRSQSIHF